MKKCLIVVDYQYDFVADDGKLTIGKLGQDIENNIYKKVQDYLDNNNNIIFTLDTHTKEAWNTHPESKQFNIHCEKNTKGWEPYGKLNKYIGNNNKNISFLEKKAYCPNFDFLNTVVNNYDYIEIAGVTTNICVLQTAIGLYTANVNNKRQVEFNLDKNCCAAFDIDSHKFAIDYVKNILGINLI